MLRMYGWVVVLMSVVSCSSTPNVPSAIRVATFNVSMESRNYVAEPANSEAQDSPQHSSEVLAGKLADGTNPQIRNIAEIIQRVRPDILLLNEFDYIADTDKGVGAFQRNYLSISQSGALPIEYPHYYVAPVNTGVSIGHDANGDGEITLPQDGHGFGYFPGHYGMALLSRHPIDVENIRTFQRFLWRDMPGALVPLNEDGSPYYSESVWQELRLSSKSHWDIPVVVNGKTLHVLASHPTPPVFDGPEDRNGRRNHDEVRFWTDYVSHRQQDSQYIYDDKSTRGGLPLDAPFVILGDLNTSPHEGDSIREGIARLLNHPRLQKIAAPQSVGGKENQADNPLAATHTAAWGMRADYVLPSEGVSVLSSEVFWPSQSSEFHRLVKERSTSSDHRLVWLDITLNKN